MPLRKCESCGNNLPASATARAKFCSPTCRQRGHRGTPAPLSLVGESSAKAADPDPASSDAPAPSPSRLEALEAAAARLVRLLDESDPRSAAPLNKEYRETLRELDALRAESKEASSRASRSTADRSFSASAV